MPRMRALPNVPYRVAVAAHAVPLITLPSGLWRLALAAGLPVAEDSVPHWGQGLYVVMLSVVSEALALLTLGLVRSWGEVVPAWVPVLGGRRVRPAAAVTAALAGAAGLVAVLGWAVYASVAGLGEGSIGSPAQNALLLVCYLPLIAWPPLLVYVAVAYHRRRTALVPVRV
ncbi:hypothetical protein [Streptomyces sp. NBC_00306]|uniref:hypothetical protein n=1 Tax=Streptomyces sp. NBC_00306 TaxID=2975708 RepID=UPI002E298423|nr:hypothetical protein [Streptomyces sp. NBC_00306]